MRDVEHKSVPNMTNVTYLLVRDTEHKAVSNITHDMYLELFILVCLNPPPTEHAQQLFPLTYLAISESSNKHIVPEVAL
jgi:hypothetical protein